MDSFVEALRSKVGGVLCIGLEEATGTEPRRLATALADADSNDGDTTLAMRLSEVRLREVMLGDVVEWV